MKPEAQDFEELLEKHQLKKTGQRLNVLGILFSRKEATSQPDLESVLGEQINRVTLYRILKTFEEKGIIHKIIDLNGTANYAPCTEGCSEHEHHDEHVHFHCDNCEKLYCLSETQIPPLLLPEGFKAQAINLIISGSCPSCNKI